MLNKTRLSPHQQELANLGNFLLWIYAAVGHREQAWYDVVLGGTPSVEVGDELSHRQVVDDQPSSAALSPHLTPVPPLEGLESEQRPHLGFGGRGTAARHSLALALALARALGA